ncbi:MAG: hypothetical protein CUN55_07595 [Phototrophicales bacterium]|nr:MAG: hypothetical protein CUN55_07595 [Phototrophicales bacterium]
MRKSFFITLVGMLIVMFGVSGSVYSQDSGGIAPRVIDVWPLPGVELANDTPLTITFNQAMDRSSVEAAFNIEPMLMGNFDWLDERTLAFTPVEGWPRASEFEITIDTSALAIDGTPLEDTISIQVRTLGPLEVATVVPAADATGVAADARIVVTFNRPVVPLVNTEDLANLPSPIRISPDIDGKGEWLNTSIYTFTPAGALKGGTTYTVTVNEGLTSVDGAILPEDYVWSFKTLPPQILSITPSDGSHNVLLETPIIVQFSQPMNITSVEEGFALLFGGQNVEGTFVWNDDKTTMTFQPTENLQIDSTYVINIADTAQSASGEATLDRGYSHSFRTIPYPGIQSTSPSNGQQDVYPGRGAAIYFKSPMNTETFADKVIITPETEWSPIVYSDNSLYLDFRSLPETTYTITFLAGAEDIYGNAIETDYTFSYTTRAIPTWAAPNTAYYQALQLVGGYRQNTRFSIYFSGTPTVKFQLYRLEASDLSAVYSEYPYGYYDKKLPNWVHPNKLIRSWENTFDSKGIEGASAEVLLASEEGGTLENGLYWLTMESPSRYGEESDFYQMLLGVVTANISVKRAPNEVLVWATESVTGEPLADATVTILDRTGARVAVGRTDSDGIFRASIERSYYHFIFVEQEDTYGVWVVEEGVRPDTTQNYLYTDRPIYRPDETVYFRGILREKKDNTYGIPNRSRVPVAIYAPDGQELFNQELPLTPYGTFSGEVKLPADVAIGDAYIQADGGRVYLTFTIAEFRVPEFQVGVEAQHSDIIQGETLNAVTSASFFAGGPVSNAEVYWNAYGSPTFFDYRGSGNYTFTDRDFYYYYDDFYYGGYGSIYIGDGSGTTDANGNFIISIENTRFEDVKGPVEISVEANVTDESFQTISGRTSVVAHPAETYVGLRTDRYFGRENEPMSIDLIAVDIESNPIANQTITLDLIENRWERIPIEDQFGRYDWQMTEILVESVTLQTGDDGKVSYEFVPPNAGIFRARATVLDRRERKNSASIRFWVTGTQPVWWGEPTPTIELIADKDSYQSGDVAEILVPIPFAERSTVLITTEREGILSSEVFEVEGSTLVYQLPITEEHVPTIHVSVALVKGIDEENLNPDYRVGTIALNVEPVQQTLNIEITPSANPTQPGDTLSFDVKVTDANGEPVQTELGFTLTDKAILILSAPNSGNIVDAFYGYQSNYVFTTVSVEALLDRITDRIVGVTDEELAEADVSQRSFNDGIAAEATPTAAPAAGGGGDMSSTTVDIRSDFQQTPLWQAHIVTDVDGTATVSVELPDNLTTWTLDVRGVSLDTKVGQNTTEVITTLPLLIRPATPRFMVVDDRVILAAVVNNNTPDAQSVEVTLQAEGVTLQSEATQTIVIEAGSRARVEWQAIVNDVEFVDLTFIAIGENGYQDAAKPMLATGPDGTIPVYRYTAPDRVGTAGILLDGGASIEGISLPTRFDFVEGDLVINADPSLAAATVDSLNYLKNYEHQCIEQTVSRFLPNVVNYRALRDLGIVDPELEANLLNALDFGLEKLKREQNPDGGWGWFVNMESNPLVTAYAVLGLIEARDAGFEVDQSIIDRALNFVQRDFIRPSVNSSYWELNRQAFYFYVLAKDNQGNKEQFDALLEWRLNMSYGARAYLLMAYQMRFPQASAVNDLVSDLITAAKVSATGVHWEEEQRDWWNWGSDTRTTALALNALINARPENDLLPNAVRWLMVARNGDHWETTQENVWALLALTDWMVLTGELQGNYEFAVTLNDATILEGSVTSDNVREENSLRVEVEQLLMGELNRLAISRSEGEGALYYTAHLDLRLPASGVDAISRGVTVTRTYYNTADPQTPITSATVGDTITVQLTITLTEDIYYFVLEDPIPAGTEPLDTGLLTTSQQTQGPTLQPRYEDEWRWYWGWWYFDHTEMRDEQVNLYADYLPRGSYTYSYQIKATIPGEFQTMPSEGYAFYFPEVFGRTNGVLFTVENRPFGITESE